LVVPADQVTTGAEGELVYTGTVRDDTLSGTISGQATTAGGGVLYSGTFTATRR